MPKFSVAYVKQHPVMFGMIFLVFGLLLWVFLSRGSSSSSSTTVSAGGPSQAELAAQVQLQTAQLGAQTQVEMGTLSLQANRDNNSTQVDLATMALSEQLQQIQADHQLNEDQLTASLGALQLQLGNNLAITHDNNQFMIDYAKNAQDAANTSILIGADLQKTLAADQLKGFTISTLASQIPTLSHKRGEQNQAFDILARMVSGDNSIPIAPTHSGGGGFNPLALLSPVAAVVSAVA